MDLTARVRLGVPDAERAACTVKALVKTYLERHAKPKKRSWKRDESLLTRVPVHEFGTRLANSLTSADLAKIHAEMGRDHPYAANEFLAIVKKMYNVGKTRGLVAREILNPAAGIERFSVDKRRLAGATSGWMKCRGLPQRSTADINEYAAHALWLLRKRVEFAH